MRVALWRLCVSVALLLVAVACDKPSTDRSPSRSEAAPGARERAPEEVRARQTIAARALGTLPEGVGLPPQSRVPDVAANDAAGAPVALRALAAKSPLLLVFYRGGWCPYCNFQIRSYAQAAPAFQARGVTPVAISVDKPSESARTQSAHSVPFPLLSDPDLTVHRAFNVLNALDSAAVERLRGFGIDVEKASGRRHHTIAVPAVFLVDAAGVIRWGHADTDYKSRPTVEQLLEVLEQNGYRPN